jgi:hypothetical protein
MGLRRFLNVGLLRLDFSSPFACFSLLKGPSARGGLWMPILFERRVCGPQWAGIPKLRDKSETPDRQKYPLPYGRLGCVAGECFQSFASISNRVPVIRILFPIFIAATTSRPSDSGPLPAGHSPAYGRRLSYITKLSRPSTGKNLKILGKPDGRGNPRRRTRLIRRTKPGETALDLLLSSRQKG